MTGAMGAPQRVAIHASMHALSQPLTVVSLALTLAQSSSSDAERTLALEAAAAECQRAMESVRQLRSLLDGTVEAERIGLGWPSATEAEEHWRFGGAA